MYNVQYTHGIYSMYMYNVHIVYIACTMYNVHMVYISCTMYKLAQQWLVCVPLGIYLEPFPMQY